MKSSPPYELIVIGGGSAGHAAASNAVSLGLRCALVESAPVLGGLCILRGCMPSKILIETANRMRAIRYAAEFGIRAAAPELDLEGLRARLSHLTGHFWDYRLKSMENGGYELIRAAARFVSPEEIEIVREGMAPEILRSHAFVIATGSTPFVPDLPGLADTPFWTSDEAVTMPRVPRHVAIIGAGAVGMEFAHFYEGIGCRVSVIARGEGVMEKHDSDLSAALLAASRDRGIDFHLTTNVSRVQYQDQVFRLDLDSGPTLETDTLLVATGRTPHSADLGLEDIGVAMERSSIIIDERSATSLRNIFAAGDCASPVPVVHLAVKQGEVAARNACRMIHEGHVTLPAEWNREATMAAWFTEPQCLEIGTGEAAAHQNRIPYVVGRLDYQDHGKGMIVGSRHGLLKVIAARDTGRLIGAVGIGPQVAETGHLLQFAIARGLTAEEYIAIPHYHPTLAEAWSRAVEDAEEKRKAFTEDSP